MPVQGSLRDLSALEVVQLIGAQRKTVALKIESDDSSVFFHFRDGLLVAAHPRKPRSGVAFVETLVGLGHIAPADGIRLVETSRSEERDLWTLALEIAHLDRETLETVYLRALEAQLDRVLLWEQGKFSMLPPGGVDELIRPGIPVDMLLVDAMRRLDELAAWKQGDLPPRAVPTLHGPDEWHSSPDPLRRAVARQIDGRRTIAEVAAATRLGEHDVYETIAAGVEGGWIQILAPAAVTEASPRFETVDAVEPPSGDWRASSHRPVVRKSPVAVVLAILLTLGLGSSWASRRISTDRSAWDSARVQWEEVDLQRLIEVWRYRHGAYPSSLSSLAEDRLPLSDGAEGRWEYRIDGTSYTLTRR